LAVGAKPDLVLVDLHHPDMMRRATRCGRWFSMPPTAP